MQTYDERYSTRTSATWAVASRCSACYRRFRTRWSGRSFFSITSARSNFAPGKGVDVRPHPHIGLATVTYLFEGAMMHRDSTGPSQRIEPGDVNWMTAGSGIVHSGTLDARRPRGHHTDTGCRRGLALPKTHEQSSRRSAITRKRSCRRSMLPGRDHAPDRGHGVRPHRAHADVLADVLYRGGDGGGRDARTRNRSTRNARSTRSRASCVSRATRFRRATWQYWNRGRRCASTRGSRALHAPRRRENGRRSVDLVELCRQLARVARRGVRALAHSGLSAGAGRDRVHPVTRTLIGRG